MGGLESVVVSRNNFTLITDDNVQKLTNRDIERIVKQWKKHKPILEIAKYFGVTRQWVHQIVNRYKRSGTIPVLHKPGRRTKDITEETQSFILQNFNAHAVGLIHLEKKIE